VGQYHRRDSGADPDHAASSSHPATARNVLPQQVRYAEPVFHDWYLTYFVKQQKAERRVLVGVEVASHGGLQKIVG
jgi:hypothetical protein